MALLKMKTEARKAVFSEGGEHSMLFPQASGNRSGSLWSSPQGVPGASGFHAEHPPLPGTVATLATCRPLGSQVGARARGLQWGPGQLRPRQKRLCQPRTEGSTQVSHEAGVPRRVQGSSRGWGLCNVRQDILSFRHGESMRVRQHEWEAPDSPVRRC